MAFIIILNYKIMIKQYNFAFFLFSFTSVTSSNFYFLCCLTILLLRLSLYLPDHA